MKLTRILFQLSSLAALSTQVLALSLPTSFHPVNNYSNNGKRQILDIGDIIGKLLDIPLPLIGDLLSLKILGSIVDQLKKDPALKSAWPGLQGLLEDVIEDDGGAGGAVTHEMFVRGLLFSIAQHDAYKEAFDELDEDLQQKVTDFLEGKSAGQVVGKREFIIPPSPAAKQHFKLMESVSEDAGVRRWLNLKRQMSPVIYENEAETKVMKVHVNAPFENWGLTVKNNPSYTFVPRTVLGLRNLVKYAKANNKRVRAAGYRHTWTNMYSEDNEIFVSMLDLHIATAVPDPSSILPNSPDNASNEFKQIELYTQDVPGSGGKKRLARIGAAVTNEEFRRWAILNNAWTLPLNVVMVEITLGGSNVPICHGGGIKHKTLSDLVREISYVDANGVHQTVSDPALLKAAAGSFGLLGVVTHVTMELDKMTYAVLQPSKENINLAIPPPPGYIVPSPIRDLLLPSQIEAARKKFVAKATQDYYSEWFWFPYQKKAFVNCWNNTASQAGVYDYPTYPDLFIQWVSGWLGGVINDSTLFRAFPGYWQATILSTLAMFQLPPNGPINQEIRTHLINGLHFRRGVQNMRVRDMELQIPIPPMANDPSKPDYTIVQKAWWDAILEVYADVKAPMRIALEMRIMSDSDIIMAPQTNNTFGTASIEVLTTMASVADGTWMPFVQKVANKWMSLKDGNGVRLKTRPHWAKEWDGMTVDGRPWKEYLKNVSYQEEIPWFKDVLRRIGEVQGWTLEDLKERFSCELLDYLFFE